MKLSKIGILYEDTLGDCLDGRRGDLFDEPEAPACRPGGSDDCWGSWVFGDGRG